MLFVCVLDKLLGNTPSSDMQHQKHLFAGIALPWEESEPKRRTEIHFVFSS